MVLNGKCWELREPKALLAVPLSTRAMNECVAVKLEMQHVKVLPQTKTAAGALMCWESVGTCHARAAEALLPRSPDAVSFRVSTKQSARSSRKTLD